MPGRTVGFCVGGTCGSPGRPAGSVGQPHESLSPQGSVIWHQTVQWLGCGIRVGSWGSQSERRLRYYGVTGPTRGEAQEKCQNAWLTAVLEVHMGTQLCNHWSAEYSHAFVTPHAAAVWHETAGLGVSNAKVIGGGQSWVSWQGLGCRGVKLVELSLS